MNRENLVKLVQRLLDGGFKSDEEINEHLQRVEKQLPYANVVELIYHTEPVLTAEQIVDEALKKKPIILGP